MEFNIIKEKLTLGEVVNYVNEVVASAFNADEEGNVGDYSPILQAIAMKYYFLKYYTDFELSDDLEKDYEKYADLDLEGYIYDSVAGSSQYQDIVRAVGEKVDQINREKCAYLVASGIGGLAEALAVVVQKVGEAQEAQLEASTETARLVKAQEKQAAFMNSVAEQFTAEEYAEVLKKQASEEMNMAEITDMVAERYLKSDSLKANINELVNSLNKERGDREADHE